MLLENGTPLLLDGPLPLQGLYVRGISSCSDIALVGGRFRELPIIFHPVPDGAYIFGLPRRPVDLDFSTLTVSLDDAVKVFNKEDVISAETLLQ